MSENLFEAAEKAQKKKYGKIIGRVYKLVNDPSYSGGLLTVEDAKKAVITGLPIYYDHEYEKHPVGMITKHWIDDENWLNIEALIYNDSEFQDEVLKKLRNNDLNHLSIGYHFSEPDDTGKIARKQIYEASVTNEPFYYGCDIAVRCSKKKVSRDEKYSKLPMNKTTGSKLKVLFTDSEEPIRPFSMEKEKQTTSGSELLDKRLKSSDPASVNPKTESNTDERIEFLMENIHKKDPRELAGIMSKLVDQLEETRGQLDQHKMEKQRKAERYKQEQLPRAKEFYNLCKERGFVKEGDESAEQKIVDLFTSKDMSDVAKSVWSVIEDSKKIEERAKQSETLLEELRSGEPVSTNAGGFHEELPRDVAVTASARAMNPMKRKRGGNSILDTLFCGGSTPSSVGVSSSRVQNSAGIRGREFITRGKSEMPEENTEYKKRALDDFYNRFGSENTVRQSLVGVNPDLWKEIRAKSD